MGGSSAATLTDEMAQLRAEKLRLEIAALQSGSALADETARLQGEKLQLEIAALKTGAAVAEETAPFQAEKLRLESTALRSKRRRWPDALFQMLPFFHYPVYGGRPVEACCAVGRNAHPHLVPIRLAQQPDVGVRRHCPGGRRQVDAPEVYHDASVWKQEPEKSPAGEDGGSVGSSLELAEARERRDRDSA